MPHIGRMGTVKGIIIWIRRAVLYFQINAGLALYFDLPHPIAWCRVNADFDKFRQSAHHSLRIFQSYDLARLILYAKNQVSALGVGKCRHRFQPAARLFLFKTFLVIHMGGFNVMVEGKRHGITCSFLNL